MIVFIYNYAGIRVTIQQESPKRKQSIETVKRLGLTHLDIAICSKNNPAFKKTPREAGSVVRPRKVFYQNSVSDDLTQANLVKKSAKQA